MDFSLSNEQEQLKRMVERFISDRADEASTGCCGEADWRLLAELGLLAMLLGEEVSGFSGEPAEEIAIVMEEFGRGVMVTPLIAEILLAGAALAHCGNREKVEALIQGRAHYAFAHVEHEARYNLDCVVTRAKRHHATIQLTGTKTHVLVGTRVDGYVVTARDEERKLGFYFVDAAALGLRRTDYTLLDGSPTVELTLENAAAEHLGGSESVLDAIANNARLAACAEMLGIMTTLFEATLDYVRIRQQFGVAIGSFQAIQHRLADLYVTLEQSRSLLYRAALSSEHARPPAIAAAKSYIGMSGRRLAEECVQLHGGMGVTDELSIGRGLKRILVLGSLFGQSEDDLVRYMALSASASHATSLG